MQEEKVHLRVELTDEQLSSYDLKENLKKLERLLKEKNILGLNISIINNRVELFFDDYFFEHKKKNSRNAGRRKATAQDKNTIEHSTDSHGNDKTHFKTLKYSDIVLKLNSGANLSEMLEYTNLKQPTYYRHLKKMKESEFYKKVDLSLLENEAYLEKIKSFNENF